MRVIPSDELKKMARSIVDEYLGNNTSLAEGIAKTALSQELNPDQIKNLVTLANVAAHTTLFDKKADDKVIEFEPADPVDVMRRVYKTATPVETPTVSAEPPMSRAEDMFGDLSEVLDKVKDMLGRCPTDAEEPAPVGLPANDAAQMRAHLVERQRTPVRDHPPELGPVIRLGQRGHARQISHRADIHRAAELPGFGPRQREAVEHEA